MPRPGHKDEQERFPHGPRNLDGDSASIFNSRSLSEKDKRKRRSVVVSDRKVKFKSINHSFINSLNEIGIYDNFFFMG